MHIYRQHWSPECIESNSHDEFSSPKTCCRFSTVFTTRVWCQNSFLPPVVPSQVSLEPTWSDPFRATEKTNGSTKCLRIHTHPLHLRFTNCTRFDYGATFYVTHECQCLNCTCYSDDSKVGCSQRSSIKWVLVCDVHSNCEHLVQGMVVLARM